MMNNNIYSDNGDQYWYNEKNQLHRDDGPAIICVNGSKFWYQNGEQHRDDGPAAIYDGEQHWYQNGLPHNENGPAKIYNDGTKSWYINGNLLTNKEIIHIKIKNFIRNEI